MKALKHILFFYKSFVIFSILIGIISVWLYTLWGLSIISGIFWLKVFSSLLTFRYIKNYKKNEFYYYQNLGLSKTKLWAGSMLIDWILFILIIYTTHSLLK